MRRYLELHIEQAVSLDRAKIPLGVVTAIAAPSRYRVSIHGRQDHAGGTPMADRRDAVAAAAELVLLVERLARDAGRGMVGTVGVIEARPNMINIVPGEADLLVDFRGIVPDAITETLAHFEQEAAELGARRSVAVEWTSLMRESPLTVPPEMVAAVEMAARAVGVSSLRLTSGASHDANHMARLCPIGLLFIRCRDGRTSPGGAEVDYLATGAGAAGAPARWIGTSADRARRGRRGRDRGGPTRAGRREVPRYPRPRDHLRCALAGDDPRWRPSGLTGGPRTCWGEPRRRLTAPGW
jgi:hydantoinase/carbamoylase family amidase